VQYESGVRRVLLLHGEALFRVEKDPARPFLVQAGSVEVRAVGTAFNVRLADKSVEVLVTHGKVRVEDAVNRLSLVPATSPAGDAAVVQPEPEGVLVAGQRMVVKPAANAPTDDRPDVSIVTLAPEEIDQRLTWRIPHLEFGGMELAQAIALLNHYNRLQISLGDTSIARLRISGMFRADNPEGFVRIVEATFNLRADRTGEYEVVLRSAR
jgi:transmembrane sensor